MADEVTTITQSGAVVEVATLEIQLAPPVTSTVDVTGLVTVRNYSDGSVQRNVWESAARASEYAASVYEQEAPEVAKE